MSRGELQQAVDNRPGEAISEWSQQRIDDKCPIHGRRFEAHLEFEAIQPFCFGVRLDGAKSIIDDAQFLFAELGCSA